MRKPIDLAGAVFGRLAVLSFVPREERRITNAMWNCRCECGSLVRVESEKLRLGYTKSCGCFRRDVKTTHGFAGRGRRIPEYYAFNRAKNRCQNPSDSFWLEYGGRGIKFLFDSFPEFLNELGYRPSRDHSLDRINNDGNYERGNVRWATREEQQRNRRPRRWQKKPPDYAERILEHAEP